MKVRITKFRMIFGIIKTSEEFKDEHSGTLLRALKTLPLKNLTNIRTP